MEAPKELSMYKWLDTKNTGMADFYYKGNYYTVPGTVYLYSAGEGLHDRIKQGIESGEFSVSANDYSHVVEKQ